MIPEDWSVPRMDKLAVIQRGASPRPIDSPIWFDDRSSTGWLRISDATKAIKYLTETTQNLSELGIANSRYVEKGNLVMSICATVGRPVLTKKNICIHDGFVVFKSLKVSMEYLYYVLTDIEKDWSKHGQTGSQMNLNTGLINSIPIPLPPTKTEQTTIANALSDADAMIQSLTRLIAKKRQIKQGAMQTLLNPYENGCLKGGWVVKKLGDVADVVGGGTPSSFNASFWNGDIDWYTPTEIGEHKYVYESRRKITKEGYSNSSTNLLPIGTILLTSRAGIGDLGILMKEGCTNQGFQSLISNESTDYEFLYYLMGTLKNQLLQNASGSTFLEISPGKLKQIEAGIPQKTEQTRIATILSDMDAEIAELEAKLAKTQQIKQGMMQNLLTGEIRLVTPKAKVVPITTKSPESTKHNEHFNEAVVIAVLADKFGSNEYPLGRKRYTKLSYLLHRYYQESISAYKKKAAGPYNPKTRYSGAEKIATNSQYICAHKNGKFTGFIASENIAKAYDYFNKWYGKEASAWLEQFRRIRKDTLELWTTVDMAIVELNTNNTPINLESVKDIIAGNEEWKPKLKRSVFSDENIVKAIHKSQTLFSFCL